MSDPLHYRPPQQTPEMLALTEALERALTARAGRIGWDGGYDHGEPPTMAQVVNSALPLLERAGYTITRTRQPTSETKSTQ